MNTDHDVSLDVTKGILIILVILGHVSTFLIFERGIKPPHIPSPLAVSDYLWVFLRQSLGFVIPVFLFISGYVLTQVYKVKTPLNIVRFYKNRLKRIYVPFLFWLSVYMLFFWDEITLSQALISLVFLDGSFHFWYIWVICVLYLAFPFLLAAARKNAARVVVGMVFLVLLSFAFKDKPFTNSYTINFLMQNKILVLPENGLYFLMGMLTALRWDKNFLQVPSSTPLLILLVSLAVVASLGKGVHYLDQSFIGDPRCYYAVTFIYAMLCLYFFLRLVNALVMKDHCMTKPLALMGQSSYGIYLSHMAVIYVLRDASGLFWPSSSSVYALATLIACTGLAYLLTKIQMNSRLRFVTGF
jgi:peptidoglycan/LPS O-acetylase OafA/YrhL